MIISKMHGVYQIEYKTRQNDYGNTYWVDFVAKENNVVVLEGFAKSYGCVHIRTPKNQYMHFDIEDGIKDNPLSELVSSIIAECQLLTDSY